MNSESTMRSSLRIYFWIPMGKTATATAWPMSSTSAMPAATTATPTAFLTSATLHREQVKIAKATKSPTIANWGPSGMRGTTGKAMPRVAQKARGWLG